MYLQGLHCGNHVLQSEEGKVFNGVKQFTSNSDSGHYCLEDLSFQLFDTEEGAFLWGKFLSMTT